MLGRHRIQGDIRCKLMKYQIVSPFGVKQVGSEETEYLYISHEILLYTKKLYKLVEVALYFLEIYRQNPIGEIGTIFF